MTQCGVFGSPVYRHLMILSVVFCLIFTSYLAIQNLQSSLNDTDGLGTISLSAMYGCIIISGILAPVIINAVGEKRVLVTSFICHVIYVGTNFYPRFETLLPSSLLLGITTGPMWISQSVYLSEKAAVYAKDNHLDEHLTLGRFNGVFFAMYETTQITGNLISSLVLQQENYSNIDENATRFCWKNDCPGISYNRTSVEKPERQIVYSLMGIFLAIDVVGVVLTMFLLPPLQKRKSLVQGHLKQSLTACGHALKDVNLLLLVPLFMFMAMEQGILWTDYTKAFISCPLGIEKIGYVMAVYGCSTAVFALSTSRLAVFTGHRILFLVAGSVDLAIFVVLYMWSPSADDVIYIYLVPAIWGISEGIWQTQSNALVAHMFQDNRNAAFANYHTWKATGFTITFIYGNFLCVTTKLLIATSLLVVALILYAFVEIRVKQTRRQRADAGTNSEPSTGN